MTYRAEFGPEARRMNSISRCSIIAAFLGVSMLGYSSGFDPTPCGGSQSKQDSTLPHATAKEALKALQGHWDLSSLEVVVEGKKNALPLFNAQVEVKGDKMNLNWTLIGTEPGERKGQTVTLGLDELRATKTIDLTFVMNEAAAKDGREKE